MFVKKEKKYYECNSMFDVRFSVHCGRGHRYSKQMLVRNLPATTMLEILQTLLVKHQQNQNLETRALMETETKMFIQKNGLDAGEESESEAEQKLHLARVMFPHDLLSNPHEKKSSGQNRLTPPKLKDEREPCTIGERAKRARLEENEKYIRATTKLTLFHSITFVFAYSLPPTPDTWYHDDLNMEQRRCVWDVLENNQGFAPYIIDGPPGTGKTLTMVETVLQICMRAGAGSQAPRIIVAAPSDASADVLALRLVKLMFNPKKLQRVCHHQRKLASLPNELLSNVNIENGAFSYSKIEDEEGGNGAEIFVVTCYTAGLLDHRNTGWVKRGITHLFVDESCQANEAECLIPCLAVGTVCSIILSGDPKQLSPIIQSQAANQLGLSLSLQERLMGLNLYAKGEFCCSTRLFNNYRR